MWLTLLALGALALWFVLGARHEDAPAASAPEHLRPALRETLTVRAFRAPSPEPPKMPTVRSSAEPVAAHAGEQHPHPLTPERDEIQHENRLIQALNDAMDLRDPARIRQMLETYRQVHGTDEHDLQDGYERIADCLEFPGPAARAEAQRYYDAKRASTLRRFVRRYCLEPLPR